MTESPLRGSFVQRNQHHFPNTSQGGKCTSSNTFSSKKLTFFLPINLNHWEYSVRVTLAKKEMHSPFSYWKPPFKNISECISACHRISWWRTASGCLTLRGSSQSTGKVPETQSDTKISGTLCVWFHDFLQIAYENV